jgi:hypothetical protein
MQAYNNSKSAPVLQLGSDFGKHLPREGALAGKPGKAQGIPKAVELSF